MRAALYPQKAWRLPARKDSTSMKLRPIAVRVLGSARLACGALCAAAALLLALAPADPAMLIQSAGGTAFDGASIGGLGVVVMFKRNMADAFAGVSFNVPAATTRIYGTGLGPLAGYTVARQNSGQVVSVAVSARGSLLTDQAGVLSF